MQLPLKFRPFQPRGFKPFLKETASLLFPVSAATISANLLERRIHCGKIIPAPPAYEQRSIWKSRFKWLRCGMRSPARLLLCAALLWFAFAIPSRATILVYKGIATIFTPTQQGYAASQGCYLILDQAKGEMTLHLYGDLSQRLHGLIPVARRLPNLQKNLRQSLLNPRFQTPERPPPIVTAV